MKLFWKSQNREIELECTSHQCCACHEDGYHRMTTKDIPSFISIKNNRPVKEDYIFYVRHGKVIRIRKEVDRDAKFNVERYCPNGCCGENGEDSNWTLADVTGVPHDSQKESGEMVPIFMTWGGQMILP